MRAHLAAARHPDVDVARPDAAQVHVARSGDPRLDLVGPHLGDRQVARSGNRRLEPLPAAAIEPHIARSRDRHAVHLGRGDRHAHMAAAASPAPAEPALGADLQFAAVDIDFKLLKLLAVALSAHREVAAGHDRHVIRPGGCHAIEAAHVEVARVGERGRGRRGGNRRADEHEPHGASLRSVVAAGRLAASPGGCQPILGQWRWSMPDASNDLSSDAIGRASSRPSVDRGPSRAGSVVQF